MKLSLYRRAVKMRWPKSYRDRQVSGDGRWLIVRDERDAAHRQGYKGFVWTFIDMYPTREEAETALLRSGVGVLKDCESLSTFRKSA
jgi:hypothetical protein